MWRLDGRKYAGRLYMRQVRWQLGVLVRIVLRCYCPWRRTANQRET